MWHMLTGVRVGGLPKNGGYGPGGTKELAIEWGRIGRKGAWVESMDRIWPWDEGEEKEGC